MMTRLIALMGLLLLAACAPDPNTAPPDLGDFRLGYNIVQARDVTKGPFSRDASADDLTTALSQEIEARLRPYDGNGLYHLGIAIGAYVLALPGLPVVYTPKSVLIFEVTIYDNATRQKLNDKPFRITAFEGLQNTVPIIGSGLSRTGDEQLANLTGEGGRALQRWLVENSAWFAPKPDQVRTVFDRAAADRAVAQAIAALPPVTGTAVTASEVATASGAPASGAPVLGAPVLVPPASGAPAIAVPAR